MLQNLLKIAFAGLVLCASPLFTAARDIATALSAMPDRDRQCLDQFFQYLLRGDPFGYTLFGKKPISFAVYQDPKFSMSWELGFSLAMTKGWETWARNQKQFPSENFVLKKERAQKLFDANMILLINKSEVLAAISQNLDLFKAKFGEAFRPEELLRQICYGNEPFFDLLMEEEALIGVLLGFGRTNGMLFAREGEIAGYLQAKFTPPFSCLGEINQLTPISQSYVRMYTEPKPSKHKGFSFRYLAEEFNAIVNKRGSFQLPGDDFYLNLIGSPQFVDYGEDAALVDSYAKTRIAIRKAYQKGPFLQVTLNQWTQF